MTQSCGCPLQNVTYQQWQWKRNQYAVLGTIAGKLFLCSNGIGLALTTTNTASDQLRNYKWKSCYHQELTITQGRKFDRVKLIQAVESLLVYGWNQPDKNYVEDLKILCYVPRVLPCVATYQRQNYHATKSLRPMLNQCFALPCCIAYVAPPSQNKIVKQLIDHTFHN